MPNILNADVFVCFQATPWAMEPISGTVFNHTVTKLKPHSVYYFKIQAETSIGGGAWSDIKAVKTGSYLFIVCPWLPQ